MIKVYYNPDCSKCNTVECIFTELHIPFNKITYLTSAPDKDEIFDLLKKLGMNAEQLIRKSESVYKEYYEGKELTEEDWINAMIKFPILIERPIIIDEERAIICRPPEKLYEFLKIR